MKQITCIALASLALPVSAQAASFDCIKASTNNEKLICSNSALSKLDGDLSSAYKAALQNHPQSESIKQKQKQWIKERNACLDISCLQTQYKVRIAQLSSSDNGAAACQAVADYANRGELEKLYVPEDRSIQARIGKLFGQTYQPDGTSWLVDLNDDGVPDPFLINVEGTAHISNGHAISGKDAKKIVDIDSNESDLVLLSMNGKYYVLTSNGSDLKQLLHMTKDVFETTCEFMPRNKPHIEITKGKDKPVCNAASDGNVKHVDFKPVDNKTALNKEVVTGLAIADIDNDGKPENIALVEYESAAGRGNSSIMVRVVDKDNPKHATAINNMLEYFDGFNVNQGVFIHDGLTYFDEASSGVILIKDGKAEEICNWRIRSLFDAYRQQ